MTSEVETRERLYRDIGAFIFAFSQLEFTIKDALARALRLRDENFDAVIAPYDFRVLCSVTSQVLRNSVPDEDGLHSRIRKTFTDCLDLNDKRVRIAHGTWFVDAGYQSVRHVSRQDWKASFSLEEAGSVSELSEKAKLLMGEIVRGFPQR